MTAQNRIERAVKDLAILAGLTARAGIAEIELGQKIEMQRATKTLMTLQAELVRLIYTVEDAQRIVTR